MIQMVVLYSYVCRCYNSINSPFLGLEIFFFETQERISYLIIYLSGLGRGGVSGSLVKKEYRV